MINQIIGSKGGGGGSSFVSKPDTLRSNDSFEILLGLGSGRWKGMVNGLKSLKINGVPLENNDGTSNFKDIYAIFADGNPLENQIVNFKLGGGGNSQSVNTPLVNTNSSGPGGWVTGAVSTPNANFIDLRFVVQQLFYQDAKSIRENTATIEIEMRPSGGNWINIFTAPTSQSISYDPNGYDYFENDGNFNSTIYLGRGLFNANGIGFKASNIPNLKITGKTSSAFVKELRIAVPNKGTYANKTWEVRARLLEKDTVDADPVSERRNLVFETITAIISQPLGDHPDWDGLVWLQVHGKASDQFSGFPEITSICDTKLCQVPPLTVFNPETRTYTATTWTGNFVEAFTTDPAWQIKEFVEDPIHGVAGLYPGATLDKWDALEASKYFSELVSDGNGGFHPRFSMNLTINEAKDVDEMMQYLAGSVNSYTEDIGNGLWRFKVDKPESPVMLFTEDNVFGEFQYSHSDIDTRFNDWRGTFLDESLDYETNTVRVFDQADIDLNGTKFTEIALIGCTHPQEALRRLMFRLRVSLNEFRSIVFETNRLGRYISPLDTILVADGALNPDHLVKSTSRLASHSGTTVNLLRQLRLQVGVNYTINFSTTDGEVISRTVTNTSGQRGDVTQIFINTPLPATVMVESAVALSATGLAALPVAYRVLSVERSENQEDNYVINAIQIDTGKWAAMDNVSQANILAQETVIAIGSPTAPAGGIFKLVQYVTDTQHKRVLEVNWNRPSSNFFDGYRVEYRLNNGPWFLANENQKDSFFELQNPEDGTYDFKITALDRRGVQSNPLIAQYVLNGSSLVTPGAHNRGPVASRPATGPYAGFRFTVTDANPPVTQVWEANTWVNEVNLVTQGSQIGVENGATVGMTTAEEALFAQAQVDINNLFTTYGSTASAAASATAAQTAATNAQTARTQAEAARNAAQAAETNAIAQAAASAGSATSAAGSATVATNQANSASGSATSATASANLATSKAADALASANASATSASSATTQATNAATSASAANTSAVSANLSSNNARDIVAAEFPSDFSQDDRYWTRIYSGPSYDKLTDIPSHNWTFPSVAGIGKVAQAVTPLAQSIKDCATRGRLTILPNRKYRVSARARYTDIQGGGGQCSTILYAIKLGAAPIYTELSNDAIVQNKTVADGWFTMSLDIDGNIWLANGWASLSTLFRVNPSQNGNTSVTHQIQFITTEDVTESQAAATSASSAAVSATNAGVSASSAQTFATNANTSASNAATSANQASTSATNAAGSASTASTQATNSANSATASGNSATAANNSATVATTQANNASTSASSASSSANTATTQAGNAASSASSASSSAAAASASASSASSSSTLSATYAINSANNSRAQNFIPNSSFDVSDFSQSLRHGDYAILTRNQHNANGYFIPGINNVVLQNTVNAPTASYFDACILKSGSFYGDPYIPATPGKRYQFSAFLGSHRADVQLYLGFTDAAFNTIAYSSTTTGRTPVRSFSPGDTLADLTHVNEFAIAPAGTKWVWGIIRGHNTSINTTNYVWIMRPFLGEALSSQTTPSLWSEGDNSVYVGAQANIATTQAAIATSASASASASAVLSATLSTGAINRNSQFTDYPLPGVGNLPTTWTMWSGASAGVQRVVGSPSGFAVEFDCQTVNRGNFGILQQPADSGIIFKPGDYIVLETDVELISGSLGGLGRLIRWYDGSNQLAGTPDLNLAFLPDSTGVLPYTDGANQQGVAGRIYRWKNMVRVPTSFNPAGILSMQNYFIIDQYFYGYIPKKIRLLRCGVRMATPAEIRDQTVLAPMEATVASHSATLVTQNSAIATNTTNISANSAAISTANSNISANTASIAVNAAAIATVNGAAAFYEVLVGASGGNNAIARLKAGSSGSSIDLVSDKITLRNSTNGNIIDAVTIQNGDATFSGQLNVGGTSGARTTINKNVIKVFDASGVKRVQIGDLSL